VTPLWPPGIALARLHVQRPELVDAYPAVVGWAVVEIQDPAHRRDEVRIGGGLPRRRGLPRDVAVCRMRRSASRLSSATMPSASRWSRSLASDHVENAVIPQSAGDVRAIMQIHSGDTRSMYFETKAHLTLGSDADAQSLIFTQMGSSWTAEYLGGAHCPLEEADSRPKEITLRG
jgi:hypothetical protein